MKVIMKFIWLKVLEIGLVLGIPYCVGVIAWRPAYLKWLVFTFAPCFWSKFLLGVITLIFSAFIVIALFAIIGLIVVWVRKNWEIASR